MSKDYYRTLGVLDDAEDIVIKAAYKALAQRYHPDKWVGNKDEATRRMSDINEAYGVLSDPVKRKQYDSTRDKNSYQAEPEDDELSSSVESDWKKVIKFFPDLVEITQQLAKISKSLESSYKITLLEQKEFTRRKELAEIFENHFLERYFGTNKTLIEYVKQLIYAREKDALKAVNEAVNLLGSNVDPLVIIDTIDREWKVGAYRKRYQLATQLSNSGSRFDSITNAIEFLHLLGYHVDTSTKDPYAKTYTVTHSHPKSLLYFDKKTLLEHSVKIANDFLGKNSF